MVQAASLGSSRAVTGQGSFTEQLQGQGSLSEQWWDGGSFAEHPAVGFSGQQQTW